MALLVQGCGGGRWFTPSSRYTLDTATCRIQFWFCRKITGNTPASLNATCSYHERRSTGDTSLPPYVKGGMNGSAGVWCIRRYRSELRSHLGRMVRPWQWWTPSDTWDGIWRDGLWLAGSRSQPPEVKTDLGVVLAGPGEVGGRRVDIEWFLPGSGSGYSSPCIWGIGGDSLLQ